MGRIAGSWLTGSLLPTELTSSFQLPAIRHFAITTSCAVIDGWWSWQMMRNIPGLSALKVTVVNCPR